MNHFTILEKLGAVEQEIDRLRRTGGDVDHLRVLRAVAADIRGRLETAPSVALVELERRMAAVSRAKTRLGYENGALVGVAQELIGRWPVVKQALERFGAEIENGEAR